MMHTFRYKVRQTLKLDSEDATDRRFMEAKAQRALDEHNEELDATRGMNTAAAGGGDHQLRQTKVLRGGETRPVGHSNVLPKIITRKVKVKQVDQASIVCIVSLYSLSHSLIHHWNIFLTGTAAIEAFKHGSKGQVSYSTRNFTNKF